LALNIVDKVILAGGDFATQEKRDILPREETGCYVIYLKRYPVLSWAPFFWDVS